MLLAVHSHNNRAASSGAASTRGESKEAFCSSCEDGEGGNHVGKLCLDAEEGLGREEQPWGCCSVRVMGQQGQSKTAEITPLPLVIHMPQAAARPISSEARCPLPGQNCKAPQLFWGHDMISTSEKCSAGLEKSQLRLDLE